VYEIPIIFSTITKIVKKKKKKRKTEEEEKYKKSWIYVGLGWGSQLHPPSHISVLFSFFSAIFIIFKDRIEISHRL
jgi:hypothetical protein